MRALPHPDRDQIELAGVLEALSDPTRLAVVLRLADSPDAEPRCGTFLDLGSKTNLTYHFAKLRSAGVVRMRAEGTSRYMSLRRADLDSRFPGLLDNIIAAAGSTPAKSAAGSAPAKSAAGRDRKPAGRRATRVAVR
jgi:DNA-binding transcriptional ArsR family regulator